MFETVVVMGVVIMEHVYVIKDGQENTVILRVVLMNVSTEEDANLEYVHATVDLKVIIVNNDM